MSEAARKEGREAALAELGALLGDRLTTAQAMREVHGRDESWHAVAMPDAVAFAQTTEEVATIVRICAAHDMPVIPFGAGTSLEGHVSAVHGGLSLDLTRMDRILEVNAGDLDVRVEAGVTRKALNEHLRDTGLFFPIDPGANATLGGMVATRASGTNAVRYGTMRENVLALTAVMADGSIVHTGTRARKSSAGYDLTRLLVGSEGTLGIVTEVTLRLYGIPEAVRSGVVPFASLEGAVDAVIETIQSGLPIARIEILDPLSIRFRSAPATPIRNCRSPKCRRSSSSSTAPRLPSPSRRSGSAPSRRSMVRVRRNGPRKLKTAHGSGRRGTMPITRRSLISLARRAW